MVGGREGGGKGAADHDARCEGLGQVELTWAGTVQREERAKTRSVGRSVGRSATDHDRIASHRVPGATSGRPGEQSLKSRRGKGKELSCTRRNHDGARCAMLDRVSYKRPVETWLCLHQTIAARHDARVRRSSLSRGSSLQAKGEKTFQRAQPKNVVTWGGRQQLAGFEPFEPQKAGPL